MAAGKSPASPRYAPYPGKWAAGLLPATIREYTKKAGRDFLPTANFNRINR